MTTDDVTSRPRRPGSRPRSARVVVVLVAAVALAACGSDPAANSDVGPATAVVDVADSTAPVGEIDARGDDAGEADDGGDADGDGEADGDGRTAGSGSSDADAPPTVASSGSSTVATPAAVESAPPRTISLAFSGDVLPHSPLWRGAAANAGGVGHDFRPMLARIAPTIEQADLAVCHLETPIAPEGEPLSTDPLYGVPAEIVEAIAASGHDRCSTASNHVLDRGVAGIDRTIEVLEAYGLGQSGSARTPDEIEPNPFAVQGVAVTHLSYTYATNGIPIPAAEPWRSALIDPERIIADARRARELGSEFTIVSLHWGREKQHEPTAEQRAVADALTRDGLVDLIVGHHAHVVQPIEIVNGVWVAYGLGDLLSNLPAADHWPAASQDGIVVRFDVTVSADGSPFVSAPIVRPTWVDKANGWIVRDVVAELADASTPEWRRVELEASLARTDAVVGTFVAE